jgi:hypothetical protein
MSGNATGLRDDLCYKNRQYMRIFSNTRMFRLQSTALLVIGALLPHEAESEQAKKHPSKEQIKFGLEESVNQPVPIPDAVLAALKTDSEVRTSRCVDGDQPSLTVSALWFEASQIHLDGAGEIDLLVKAKNGCLLGANIGPFWIFRKAQDGYELVLNVSALGLELLPTRTNGHKDVSAGAVAGGEFGTVVYKFDGRRYQEFGNKAQEIK